LTALLTPPILRIVLGALILALFSAVPEGERLPELAVIFAAAPKSADDAWIPGRLADLTARRLELLGAAVRDRRFLDPSGHVDLVSARLDGVLFGRVRPEATVDPTAELAVEAELRTSKGRTQKKLAERAENIERLATQLALAMMEAAGRTVSDEERALVGEAQYAFSLDRALGIARAHFDRANFRQAMVMYDRASSALKIGAVPEAIAGRLLAESALVSAGEMELGARADLAPPAEERAQVALKQGNDQEAMKSLDAVLKYTPDRARRWALETPLERGGATVIARGSKWIVQSSSGEKRRFSIDPRTGVVTQRDAALAGLVDLASGNALVLDGRTLARIDEQGRSRWKVSLPLKPRSQTPEAVELTSGLAGVMGDDAIAWVEVSFGQIAQAAASVKPLASGTGGILVQLARGSAAEGSVEVGLLRPGKKTPAWTAVVPEPRSAAMTVDRVLIVSSGGLSLLRSHDGKESARTIALAGPSRILGAEGRYGAVLLESGEVAVVDVLGGEKTATIKGPSPALSAYTSASGMAILYASGDLVFYDRDGAMLDRALAPGEPLMLLRGSPMTPGPVAVTTRGLFAYAEVASDGQHMRDVDAMLRMAQVLEKMGETKMALSLARDLALASSGRVDRAEDLRFSILWKAGDAASKASARAAAKRVEAAKDPTRPLPPFRLVESP
jgi:tetratricopeptide (TPR) repeat protein